MDKLLGDEPKRILDAGCGSGGSGLLLFGELLSKHQYVGLDISDAVRISKERFDEKGIRGTFIQSDLFNIPAELGNFDVIFSEGVLHQTDSVDNAIAALSKRLNKGGLILFYIYAKKAPVREFTDDYIRNEIADLSDEDAWKILESLTKLGIVLGEMNAVLDIPEDIPCLGITSEKYELQRFFYYTICKAFYRPDYTMDEMNHINFDWFRAANCHRHTPEEIKRMGHQYGLNIKRMYVEGSGISVIARKY